MTFKSGYRRELEPVAKLKAGSKPMLCKVPAHIPDQIDCRDWLQIENQGSQGSCSGHMLTSALEYCNWVQTKGGIVQLSRQFAYLNGQKHCGLFGEDQGGTIDGVCEAAKADGVPQESTFPYPGHYVTSIPQAAYDEAKGHKLRSYTFLKSYQEVFAYLATGVGAVCCGVPWVESFANNEGIIEEQSGGMYGWHAIPLIGYSTRKSGMGNHYLWLPNSHGREWGENGWAEVAPQVVENWCQSDCVVIGVSDLQEYGTRPFSGWGSMY